MSSCPANPRILLAGSVVSTERALGALVRNGMNIVGVLGLDEGKSANVSGYAPLESMAKGAGLDYLGFTKINAPEVVEWARTTRPDVLMIVGLSQLIGTELMSVPTVGTVGFHPTMLPKGRGRAPVAWLVHDQVPGAATFFVIDEGVDAGPILVQTPFDVQPTDDAAIVVDKILDAIDAALDDWLPKLRGGEWLAVPQDASQATYNGKRDKVDGLIDWSTDADSICRLVRMSSHPHPGAYTFHRGEPLIIWKAEEMPDCNERGVVGRVLSVEPSGAYRVQAGSGVVKVLEHSTASEERRAPRVGELLGFPVQQEVFELRKRVAKLEALVEGLAKDLQAKAEAP